MSFTVSAPGKVILFGEHSVVHNRPAIAAAVGLRTYTLVSEPEKEDEVTLNLVNMDFAHSWKISELPFRAEYRDPEKELDAELLGKLKELLKEITNSYQHDASLTFLYLYCSICSRDKTPARTFTVRSLLPVSAGLGSSASYSVCVSASLLKLSGRETGFDTVNGWSFLGEKTIHGNPSGIDNAVATQGGAVYYQRQPAKLISMENFPPMKLMLTNTKVPRRTLELVSNVGEQLVRLPKVMNPILDAMGNLVDETYGLMNSTEVGSAEDLSRKLAELIRLNHGLLVSIGVSHPALERVRSNSDVLGLGETKLTGAGGGGCAITLVLDDDKSKLSRFKEQMPEFEVFETLLGAPGVGFAEIKDVAPKEFVSMSKDRLEKIGEWVY